jgi:hypothetical protein
MLTTTCQFVTLSALALVTVIVALYVDPEVEMLRVAATPPVTGAPPVEDPDCVEPDELDDRDPDPEC